MTIVGKAPHRVFEQPPRKLRRLHHHELPITAPPDRSTEHKIAQRQSGDRAVGPSSNATLLSYTTKPEQHRRESDYNNHGFFLVEIPLSFSYVNIYFVVVLFGIEIDEGMKEKGD
ncbi:hypothetical protein RYX36_009522 [Vicia faba]